MLQEALVCKNLINNIIVVESIVVNQTHMVNAEINNTILFV